MNYFKQIAVVLGLLFSPLISQASDKNALEQIGLKIELLQNDVPSVFTSKNGFSHVVLKKSAQPQLRLTNQTDERLNIIFSFNRLNPLTGQPAILKDKGFVLRPNEILYIAQGRMHKKDKTPVNLFEQLSTGFLNFSVFKERTDYPLILPNMTPPPYHAEQFIVHSDGSRRWIAPHNYPFRRIQQDPNAQIYATFSVEDEEL